MSLSLYTNTTTTGHVIRPLGRSNTILQMLIALGWFDIGQL